MPNKLLIKRDHIQPNVTPLSEPCEAHPIVIKEINSVTPSAAPRTTGHWLKRLFQPAAKPVLPETMPLAEFIAQTEKQRPALQAQEDASCRGWLKAGAALTLFSVAGALAWGMNRRPEKALAKSNTPANTTALNPILPGDMAAPQALALAGYPAPGPAISHDLEATRLWASTQLSWRIRNDLLARFPGMQAEAVERLLIAPLLKLLLESIYENSVNEDLLAEQLARLVHATLSTLSVREHLQLYRRERTDQDNLPFSHRFIAHNGRGYIQFARYAYSLQTRPDGTPFIVDLDGRCHFIRYNQRADIWEYVEEADNYAWSAEAQELITRHHLRLANLPERLMMDYYPQYDSVGINSTGWIHTQGLFMAGNFLPTWSPNNVVGETYTNRSDETADQSRILLRGDYGWEFEPPSVRMDPYLKALLESGNKGVNNDHDKAIGRISKTDGLSLDRNGKSWLKKDNQYFRAERNKNTTLPYPQLYLPDYANARLEYKKDIMSLKQAEGMPLALDTTTVENTLISSGPFTMEVAAVDYLQKNALTTNTQPVESLEVFHPGLAEDANYDPMLVINDKKYAVRNYSKYFMGIKSRNNPSNPLMDIFLWVSGDRLLRVRNDPPDVDYIPLHPGSIPGIVKGAPPIVVEAELHRQLNDFIDAGRDIALPANIKKALKMKKLLLLWSDERNDKDYFLYGGRYFPAMLVDVENPDNPLSHPRIDVFANENFYDQQELIASLVPEVKVDRLEIKADSTLLSERLRVNKPIATLYCEDIPWSRFSDMATVVNAVNEVRARGRYHLAAPAISPSPKQDLLWGKSEHREQIKNKLYPSSVNTDQLDLFRLVSDKNTLSPTRQNLQNTINGTLHLLTNEMLPRLLTSSLYNSPGWSTLQPWFRKAVKESKEELFSEIAVEWQDRLQNMHSRLRLERVYLIDGDDVNLQQYQKLTGDQVFISPASKIIYINTHKINPDDKTPLRLVAELITKTMSDYLGYTPFEDLLQTNGMYPQVSDSWRGMIARLRDRQVRGEQLTQLQDISKKYLQGIPAYIQQFSLFLEPDKLAYLANYDPAYRAYLLTNIPALISLLTLDSYFLLASNDKRSPEAEEWLKQYAALRATTITTAPLPVTSATTTSSTTTTSTTTEKEYHVHIPEPHHWPHKKPPTTSSTQSGTEERTTSSTPSTTEERTTSSTPSTTEERTTSSTPSTTEERTTSSTPSTTEERTTSSTQSTTEERTTSSTPSTTEERTTSSTPSTTSERTTTSTQLTPTQEATDSSQPKDAEESPDISRSRSPSAPAMPPGPGILANAAAQAAAQAAGHAALVGAGLAVGLNAPDAPDESNAPDNPGMVIPRINMTDTTKEPSPNTTTAATAIRIPAVAGTPSSTRLAATNNEQAPRFFVKPEDQDKTKGERFKADSHDDVFIPNAPLGHTPPSTEPRVYVEGHGKVLMLEIPELACLGEKDLTLAEELRFIGQALVNPVTANALAQQEIIHIDIRGGDCPSAEDVYWLQDRTTAIDAVIDLIMMMVPQLRLLFAFRMFVGPLLLMAADDLEGKEITWKDRAYYFLNAAMQFLSLFKIEVPTLKGAQRSSIFYKGINKKPEPKPEKPPFGNHFSFIRDNDMYVKVEDGEYPLLTSYDEAPMVTTTLGQDKLIKFNQNEERWNFEEDIEQAVRDENKSNQNKFKLPLATLPRDVIIEAEDNEFFTIKRNGKPDITGVFTDMEFIPARLEHIGAEVVAYTASESVPQQDQRLLIYSNSGWEFERSTAKMNRNLNILLSNKNKKGFDYSHNTFGAIRKTDGVSHDPRGGSFIKKDYKYYRVEKIDSQNDDITYKLPDFPGAVVRYKQGYLILEGGSDILSPAKTELVTGEDFTFRIEADALSYLRSHGLTTSEHYANHLSHGIYEMTGRPDKAFVVNKKQFTISYFGNREMHIKHGYTYGPGKDIKFWLDKNTWYRVRDESPEAKFEYESLASCRVARTPGLGSSCPGANIMIEAELSKRLIQEGHDSMAADSVPVRENLVEVRANDIPYLYQDKQTNKYYYKYGRHYFNAKIIEANNIQENPTGFPCVKITGRSDFYSAEKYIALIVMYDDGTSIRMADMSTFIAQKLNISQEEAIIYNKKAIFNNMEHIDFFERITNEAQLLDDLYVEQARDIKTIPEYYLTSLTGSSLEDAASKALFPESVLRQNQYAIHTYDFDTPAEKTSAYAQDAIKFVKRNFDYLNDVMLPRVMNSFSLTHYNHPVTEDYLTEILKKENSRFIKKAELSFFSRLVSAKNEINHRKIKLMSVVDNTNNEHPSYAKEAGQAVYIGDTDHIYINIDLLNMGENAKADHAQEITGAILSAALRASGKGTHIFDIPRNNGVFVNIKDAYRALRIAVRTSILEPQDISRLQEVSMRYLQNSAIHQPHLERFYDIATDWRKFHYLLRFDPGLRTQLMLNSDELLTLATQDINYLISSTEQEIAMLHPWVKMYGKVRDVLHIEPEKVQLTDAMTSHDIELSALTPSSVSNMAIRELPGNKGIYNTEEGKMLYKWKGRYYPLEFFGPSGTLISLGASNEVRQVYYYTPQTGELSPLQKSYTRNNVITYDDDLDLYVSTAPASDYSAILKFDKESDLLTLTGATRITHLPGKVSRIEYPWFNLYHPQGASNDIYIQGQGKILITTTILPQNIKLTYYTNPGGQLLPYPGDTEGLLTNRFTIKDIANPGEVQLNYMITPMSSKYINYYRMARKYNKNLIQLRTTEINSAILIEAASKIFPDDEINVHFYMGRINEGQRQLPAPPVTGSPQLNRVVTDPSVARWAFDQQVTGGAIKPDKVLQGFIPLKETHVYLHYGTTDGFARTSLEHMLKHPFDIFYGLDLDPPENNPVPAYIKEVRVQVAGNMKKAKRSLDAAWMKLNTPAYRQSIYDYFAFAFDLNDEAVLEQIFSRFRTNVSRVRNFLMESSQADYENIGIASTQQTPDPAQPGLYRSKLTDPNYLGELPAAFIIPGDAYRRIYIMGDTYPQMEINRKVFDRNAMELEHILTHEASHLAANTYDITYIDTSELDYTEDGLNVQDAQRGLRQVNTLLESDNIKSTAVWRDFVSSIYNYLGQEIPDDATEVINMIKNSPMIKANLISTNADSFAVFVKHVSNLGTDGRYKRETDEEVKESDYKHLGLLFAAAREHHIFDLL